MACATLTARGYGIWSVAALAFLCVVCVGLCWYADPFAVLRDSGLRGERFVMRHPRMTKPHMLERALPATLLLGSSRVEQGLDPLHPSLDHGFNAALPGATAYEIRRTLQHALAVAPVRRVVVELAPFQFGTFLPPFHTGFTEARLAVDPEGRSQPWHRLSDLGTVLWSLETLEAALHCANPFGVRRLPLDRIYPRGANHPELIYRRILSKRSERHSFDLNAAEFARGTYRTFSFTNQDGAYPGLDEVERIALACAAQSVRLQIVMSPEHDRQTVLTRLAGLAPGWHELRRRIVATVATACPGAEIWDFSCAPGYTDEIIPPATQAERTMRWYNDGGHFTRALGDAILDRLAGGGDPTFGRRLDHTDLDAVFAQQHAAIAAWEHAQPAELAAITAIWNNPTPPPANDG
jgi:hypothetical protein